ncbi:hypothetical protein SLS62_009196 [Diatrype stigma]|uniref:Alpha-L-rhamnosidase n=1 Tax=Diatrype stigma TaxID=117547 RepID=A0AAN9YK76_9PEZI
MFTHSPRSALLAATYQLGFSLLLSLFPCAADSQYTSSEATSSWQRYVRAPPSRLVRPKAILSQYTQGSVVNPEGLLTGTGPPTLLLRMSSDGGGNASSSSSSSSTATIAPTLVIDFGQNVVGQPVIEFAGAANTSSTGGWGGSGGGRFPGLQLAFSESLEFLSNRSDFTRSDNAGGIAVKSQPYTWIDQWSCEFDDKVCSDGLHGFRYLKITLDALSEDSPYTSAYGYVSISSIRLQWSGYLGTPETYSGWFECSDEDLTQWWYDGSYTTEMCTDVFRANDTEPRQAYSDSLMDKVVIHDGPKRDRDPYMGDLAVSALTMKLMTPLSNNYGLGLFDYPLWWVSCSWDLVMYTGNLSYIQAYYPTLLSVLDNYYVQNTDNSTSLLLRPPGYGDYAFIPRDGSAAYYSALYVLALKRAADLADRLGEFRDAARWRDRASRASRAVLDVLWDDGAGAFLDRRCEGCAAAHAQDGNSLAILAGIAGPARAASALAYLANATARPWGNAFYDGGGEALGPGFSDRVYAFISYFETAARFEQEQQTANVPTTMANTTTTTTTTGSTGTGIGGTAIDQLRRTYGWMSRRDPGATFWEGVGGPDGAKYQGAFTSLAHGWSTGVTPLLTTYVLGVKPLGPGFAVWAVKPPPPGRGRGNGEEELRWARGEVPTPQGPLRVSWERGSGSSSGNGAGGAEAVGMEIRVRAPPGTSGTVSVPAAPGDAEGKGALLNGVAGVGVLGADGYVVFEVQGGGGGGGGGEQEEHVVGYPPRGEKREAERGW